ncbi:MAG: ABC transporter ATP-binding protein [Acidobacteriota bacterium]
MAATPSIHEEQKLGKVFDRQLFRRLLTYIGPHRRLAIGAVLLILLSSMLQLVGPLTTAVALDLFIRPLDGANEMASVSRWVAGGLDALGIEPDRRAGVAGAGATLALSLMLAFFVLYAQSWLMQVMGQRVMYDLRQQIFAHLQRLSVRHLDRTPVGRLVTRATTDVAALNELFASGLVHIVGDIVLLVGILLVLFALDWRLALISFIVLPLLGTLTLWFKTRARRSYRAVRVLIARINAYLQEHIGGMAIVQLFGRETRARDDFAAINAEHRDANVRSIFYYAVYFPGVELITSIGAGLIVWYGGGQVIQGALSIGALVAFLQYVQRFYQPLADLSEKYNVLQAAMASAERIFELLDTPPEIASPPDAHGARPRGAFTFERVTFGYRQAEPVLHDIELDVAAGETIAVVGHTGAGKSTLANLLLRFYDVDEGRVLVDGVDVRDWDLASLRGGIAMVLQDVFLFSGTIADNIRLGHPEITDAQVRAAAREVHALPFIERLPDGFDTRVRERGAGLSVGQKQLIAFARALAFDPAILVLDEATASIDTETEQIIQSALDRLLVGRTSLVIAHRLSTIQRADRIVVMHSGAVREQGTHQALLAQGGLYHTLHQLQYATATAAGG